MACCMSASATARRDDVLLHEGAPLTSERVRTAVDHWLLDRDFINPMSIIAGGPAAADCHVHEPPLLDTKGPALLAGEVLTVEPGLYRRDLGGVRIEDMVVVTEGGCENLNTLADGLSWK